MLTNSPPIEFSSQDVALAVPLLLAIAEGIPLSACCLAPVHYPHNPLCKLCGKPAQIVN